MRLWHRSPLGCSTISVSSKGNCFFFGRDRLTPGQEDYLEALSTMVEAYERQHAAATVAGMSPIEALSFLLEENGMSGSDLGRLLGTRQLGSAILRGKRSLSKAHISALCKRFSVDASLFLA